MTEEVGTILVVEDDPATANLLCEALDQAGYHTLRAREGGEALRMARERRPGAITLDLALPGLDGRSFLLGLRSEAAIRRTPVVVVSANAENLSTFERHALAGVLPKPFDIEVLVSMVTRAIAAAPSG